MTLKYQKQGAIRYRALFVYEARRFLISSVSVFFHVTWQETRAHPIGNRSPDQRRDLGVFRAL